MQTLEAYIPDGIYSVLVIGIVALVVIWLVIFVVRTMIGIALIAGIILGGFMLWQDPALLRTIRDNALDHYHHWYYDT